MNKKTPIDWLDDEYIAKDEGFQYPCHGCGRMESIEGAVEGFERELHYCGGSPSCRP